MCCRINLDEEFVLFTVPGNRYVVLMVAACYTKFKRLIARAYQEKFGRRPGKLIPVVCRKADISSQFEGEIARLERENQWGRWPVCIIRLFEKDGEKLVQTHKFSY